MAHENLRGTRLQEDDRTKGKREPTRLYSMHSFLANLSTSERREPFAMLLLLLSTTKTQWKHTKAYEKIYDWRRLDRVPKQHRSRSTTFHFLTIRPKQRLLLSKLPVCKRIEIVHDFDRIKGKRTWFEDWIEYRSVCPVHRNAIVDVSSRPPWYESCLFRFVRRDEVACRWKVQKKETTQRGGFFLCFPSRNTVSSVNHLLRWFVLFVLFFRTVTLVIHRSMYNFVRLKRRIRCTRNTVYLYGAVFSVESSRSLPKKLSHSCLQRFLKAACIRVNNCTLLAFAPDVYKDERFTEIAASKFHLPV